MSENVCMQTFEVYTRLSSLCMRCSFRPNSRPLRRAVKDAPETTTACPRLLSQAGCPLRVSLCRESVHTCKTVAVPPQVSAFGNEVSCIIYGLQVGVREPSYSFGLMTSCWTRGHMAWISTGSAVNRKQGLQHHRGFSVQRYKT